MTGMMKIKTSPSPEPTTTPTMNSEFKGTQQQPSRTPQSGEIMGTGFSTPNSTKLRRKVPVEDAMEDVNSVQRLVEYFVVVSSQPRWESKSPQKAAPPPPPPTTPEVKRPQPPVSTPAREITETEMYADSFNESCKQVNRSCKKMGRSLRKFRKPREKGGTVEAITHSYSSEETESREDVIAPPKPRGTWTKDEDSERTDGNIHIPTHDSSQDHTFQPKVTARYPPDDYQDNPLNPMVTQFCYPVGDVIVPSEEYHMPRVHHFVLTNEKGRKIYGTCLTIYEEYHPPADVTWRKLDMVHSDSGEKDIEVTVDSAIATLYMPKCLCILSFWPYVNAFREYLSQLYRLASSTNCMTAPIERYIMNLCVEIPAPPPGAFEVQVSILDSIIRFWAPPAKLPIAFVALPYQTLFDCLDIDNIMHLFLALTMERKILLVSSQHSILTVCCEILCSLLFPMRWSHLYVPLLPRFLSPVLDAPVPYLCGVTRENWLHVQQFVNEETIIVDLDRNSVMFGKHTPPLPSVPGKKWTKLQASVQQITGHLFWRTRGLENEYRQFSAGKLSQWNFKRIARQKGDVRWNEKLETFDHAFNLQFTPDSENLNDAALEREQHQWDRLQESFIRFFVAVLKDYRKFLTIPKSDLLSPKPGSGDWLGWSKRRSFDGAGFIAAQKHEYFPYLSEFCGTQQFDDFITRRLYNPEMPDLIFFDQSIDAKLNRSRLKLKKVDTPFLQSAQIHKTLKSFKAVEPNAADLPTELEHVTKAPFMYKTWPETFDSRLFCKTRPIPTMITAEFDRQKALSFRLRAHHSPGMETGLEKRSELLDFYGSDYDTSPETMAFTVFFFTYSSVIGREWETYQKKRRELDAGRREILERDAETAAQQEDMIPQVQVEVTDQDMAPDMSSGLCGACPQVDTSVNNTMIYVSEQSPCPRYANDLNSPAQVVYDVISQMAQSSFGEVQQQRVASLLDNDDGLAEYEEAREVAVAQLDLAFDTLKSLELRGLPTDSDVFKSLMEACGRCGDTDRALGLIQTMKRDGLVADKEILSCFVATFSHGETGCLSPMKDDFIMGPGRQSDAYSSFLKKKLEAMGGDASAATILTAEEDVLSDVFSDSGDSCVSGPSTTSTVEKPSISYPLFEWLTPRKKQKPKRTRKRRKSKKSKNPSNLPVTDRLLKQIVLGETLLDFLYPDLKMEAGGDTCPQCSTVMNEDNIISGWQPCEFQDHTTKCPTCNHRFVPRFSVSCSSPTFKGSQGPGTPLFCEFLSPWVLRKELNHVILRENGIDMMLDPEWRSGTDIRATLWWNLIVMCYRYRLPFSFLLQGSFQNRLINPVPQDS